MPSDRIASATVYGIQSFPTKTPAASSRSLQWTSDGQLVVLGETSIYLLTPEIGLNLELNTPRSRTPPKQNQWIRWYTTIISLPQTTRFWPEICKDWATLCSSPAEFTWIGVTYSPSGYSSVGSALLATLSSNLEVSLWSPKNDYIRGEWRNIQDVTSDVISYSQVQEWSNVQSTLSSQVQALAWSPSVPHSLHESGSFLAMGTRGGTVLFMQLQQGILKAVTHISISNEWVTHLAWTKWMASKDGNGLYAYLACALPRGRIILLEVHQEIRSWDHIQKPEIVLHILDDVAYENDRKGITSMEWVESDSATIGPILVYCKPGAVVVWRRKSLISTSWDGFRSMELHTQTTSTSATSYGQASGIIYLSQHDAIIVSLIDGTYHIIGYVSQNPTLLDTVEQATSSSATSKSLSSVARAVFLIAEDHEVERPKDGSEPPKTYPNHVGRIGCALGVDSGNVVAWIYQRIFSESFEYVPDAKIRSTLVVAPLFSAQLYDQNAINDIKISLSRPADLLSATPINILRGPYMHIRRKGFLKRHKNEIISLLSSFPPQEVQEDEEMADQEERDMVFDDSWIRKTGNQLSISLFGSERLCQMRLSLNMAMVCAKVLPSDQDFKHLVQGLQEAIYTFISLSTFKWLRGLSPEVIQSGGVFFTSRKIKQAQLSDAIGGEHPTIKSLRRHLDEVIDDTERCPACDGAITFTDSNIGKCEENHYWGRCFATSYLITTPDVRTCISCGRKVLDLTELTKSTQIPANEPVCKAFLAAMANCAMCGNKCIKTT